MPTPSDVDLGYAVSLPPKDAIAYFEAKGYRISWNWWETWQEAHARAFTVAKAARLDVLQDIRSEVQRALAEGRTLRDFQNELTPRLQARGWWGQQILVDREGQAEVAQLGSPHRLATIYRTNLQTAYMAGRYKAMKEMADTRPWWQYVAVMDSRTRPKHAVLNGRVFRHDDPFWEVFYPPQGFNCRCQVRALSDFRLAREGLTPESAEGKITHVETEVGVDKQTGEVIMRDVARFAYRDPVTRETKHVQTDPGWSYSPGAAAYGTDIEVMRKLSRVQDRALRVQAVQALNNAPERQAQWSSWVGAVLPQRGAGHSVQTLTIMSEDVADFSRAHGVEPSRLLVMNEKGLAHANSDKHVDEGVALSLAEYEQLPVWLAAPNVAVYWDRRHGNLLYAIPQAGGETLLVPVKPDYSVRRQPQRLDVLVNAFKIQDGRLADTKRFEKLNRP